MIRVNKSDRKELLSLLQQAVTLQVQLYDQLSAIEELMATSLAWTLGFSGKRPTTINLNT